MLFRSGLELSSEQLYNPGGKALANAVVSFGGVPKFLISFEQFGEYINPRFYCNPENLLRRKRRR